ncbi:MAG: hypothetical protein RL614_1181, partial [Pseudomonadota bacterium]
GILAQSGHDAKRYQALGVKNVHIVGNMKFDIASQPETLALGMHWKNAIQVQGRLAVCAASTRAGEEMIILEAWKHILTTNNWTSPPLLWCRAIQIASLRLLISFINRGWLLNAAQA